MKNVLFREATADDLPEIVRLLGDDDLGASREQLTAELDPAYHAAFSAISADPNNVVYVVEHEGGIAGCLQFTLIPNLSFSGALRGQIEGVRIDKSLRGTGIGSKFFEWVLSEAKRAGCKIVQLTMNVARKDAHRFYEKLGFKATHAGFKLYF